MKKEITHEEKFEFYKTFNSETFKNKYNQIKYEQNTYSMVSNVILFCSAIGFSFINPVFLMGLAYPTIIVANDIVTKRNKYKSLIEKINPNISYKDFKKLKRSYEWTLLGYELSAKETHIHHYAENSKLIVEEKVKNNPRSLDSCIIDDESKNNSTTEKNLINKTDRKSVV